jgi:hypothetical protein
MFRMARFIARGRVVNRDPATLRPSGNPGLSRSAFWHPLQNGAVQRLARLPKRHYTFGR